MVLTIGANFADYQAEHYAANRDDRLEKARRYKASIPGLAKTLHRSAKSRAESRGLAFDISVLQIEVMLHAGRCQRSGIPFDVRRMSDARKKPFAPSLDRVDNSRGYVFDNVQLVCNLFNVGKSDHDQTDFIVMCLAVAKMHADDATANARLKDLMNARL